jgi:hypothetical protein
LKVILSAAKAIQIAVGAQSTPSRSRNSTSVASGSSRTSCWSCSRSIFRGRPRDLPGVTSPVSGQRFLSARTQVRLMPYFSATTLVGSPASESSITRRRIAVVSAAIATPPCAAILYKRVRAPGASRFLKLL